MGYAWAEEGVPLCGLQRRGERGDNLPGDQEAPFPQLKKRSTGASEGDEWLRAVWRSVVGRIDSRSLVFVDEMGTHTSLAPLYGYSPRGHRVFFKVLRNRGQEYDAAFEHEL